MLKTILKIALGAVVGLWAWETLDLRSKLSIKK